MVCRRTPPISGWRGKRIHANTRTTAIPLHGIVRICDSLPLVILPLNHFRLNRIAGIRVRNSLLVKQCIALVLERRASVRQPRLSKPCYRRTYTGLLNWDMFVHHCKASGTTVSYSTARHPPCVDGSPVWPPDRDVDPTLPARHRACLGGSFVWVSRVPGSQIRFHLGKPGGKQRDRNGEIW